MGCPLVNPPFGVRSCEAAIVRQFKEEKMVISCRLIPPSWGPVRHPASLYKNIIRVDIWYNLY